MALKYGTLQSLNRSNSDDDKLLEQKFGREEYSDVVGTALTAMPAVRRLFAGETFYRMEGKYTDRLLELEIPSSGEVSFKVLEIELQMIYDDLYTKATVLRTSVTMDLAVVQNKAMAVAHRSWQLKFMETMDDEKDHKNREFSWGWEGNPLLVQQAPAEATGNIEIEDTLHIMVEICRKLSNYMLYLLATNQEMLSVSGSTKQFFEGFREINIDGNDDNALVNKFDQELRELGLTHQPQLCKETLEELRDIWIRLLIYAAGKSRPQMHAGQIARGGELLTFAWLIMLHCSEDLAEQLPIVRQAQAWHGLGKGPPQGTQAEIAESIGQPGARPRAKAAELAVDAGNQVKILMQVSHVDSRPERDHTWQWTALDPRISSR
ncbi:hypothetical protein PR202_ga30741 [Eleusine coracana subsp. coracana]|uniref:DUF4220 domain-containing protein n=1 Tax=Eleusine coracana subsp. coracana TaxID=191504 RepID=A0AAV5DQR4_ELECO|nr:hypothetical protein PR202_ga30741 [Eleusine coracana subsp. coracana]